MGVNAVRALPELESETRRRAVETMQAGGSNVDDGGPGRCDS